MDSTNILIKKDSTFFTGVLKAEAIAAIDAETLMETSEIDPSITPSTFNIEITTTNTSFRYVVKRDNGNVVRDVTLPLESIQSHHRHSSQSFWSVIDSGNSTPKTLSKEECYYLLDSSYPTKRPSWRYLTADSIQGLVQPNQDKHLPVDFFFKSVSSDFSGNGVTIIINLDNFNTFTVKLNGTSVNLSTAQTPNSRSDIFADLTLAAVGTPTAGGSVRVTVTSSQPELDYVELEAESGVLDRTRVKLTNGSGTFHILTNTFTAGEDIICHAGVKRYTKLATFTATLA